MEYLTIAEIREKYLSYFEGKGNKRMPSSSLIPDDPSLLLTSAGMVQFKPYFLQQKQLEAPYVGTTTVQKCVRTSDIDIIGRTGRHLSFFEMLGNFSFGAYFKKEMCAWALEFSTDGLGLDPDRLHYTVFEGDDETIGIWKALGVAEEHISRLGEKDNFWRAGPTGPCGPCSEIYFDQGPDFGCGEPDCAPGCECDRYLEYWNLVFTQYDAQDDGTLVELPKKNIDTGMGLERIAAILQGVQSNYETDVMRGLLDVGERLSGRTYGTDASDDLTLRIMADHARSVTFMIADGILPSNEGRGYVLRRLLRRAVMKATLIGVEGSFLNGYVDEVVARMGTAYPELVENHELVRRVVLSEEERFGATLRQGKAYLEQALGHYRAGDVLTGFEAFTLHDTYGFPIEVTEEIAAGAGITVDAGEFARLMDEQKQRARAHAKDAHKAWSTYGGVMSDILAEVGPSAFVGYEQGTAHMRVKALVRDGERVTVLKAGEKGQVIGDVTPFYAEKGGQVADRGTLGAEGVSLVVDDVQEPEKGLVAHAAEVVEGSVSVGDELEARIDEGRRARICRNHTATHILHGALREVLGEHVKQAGSLVAPNRLRFDFTHFEAVTPEQLAAIERLANEAIMESHRVRAYETGIAAAREAGVIALFGEKYGDVVRVLDIEGFSQELCGGTHVGATSEIGFAKIVGESSVGANLRRIEAVTSFDALAYMNRVEAQLKEAAAHLRAPLFDVGERAAATVRLLKEAGGKQKQKQDGGSVAEGSLASLAEAALDVGYPLVVAFVGPADTGALRNAWDVVRARLPRPGACVLGADNKGTPLLLAAGTPEAVEAGFDAGALIKQISPAIKGGGGGNAAMAQAGGKDLSALEGALDAARALCVPASRL
ncbi:MAG: alanine--tRNA ligase [Eggerthellaceae bacterium]|nr:alanine--tRNA ligase [Eggerthellaceae bacterium]